MANTSLLKKEGPISVKDLQPKLRVNDFSTCNSGLWDKNKSIECTKRFEKIREYFEESWRDQMKILIRPSMQYINEHFAIGRMEKSEGF